MILRGWHIARFGQFRDSRVDGLDGGVAVLHGPNEAGKSTLLAFIRGVLFGFPDRRSRTRTPLYEPRDGGHPSGRLFVESNSRSYTIARGEGRRNALTVTDAQGAELPEGELTHILGGADATLFRNVFGFSLYELQELETLTEEGVRDRIFSGAVAGAGRSARTAANKLESEAGELYRPDGRARRNRVAELLDALRGIDAELQEARREAETYPEMLAAEQQAEAEVQRLRDDVAALRRRRDRLDALLRLWDPWCDRDAALTELEASGDRRFDRARAVHPEPAFVELGRRCEELTRNVELQRERLARRAALQSDLDQTQAALDQALDTLGAGWDEERIAAFRLPIPTREEVRSWERALNDGETEIAQATARCEEAERQHEDASQAAEERQAEVAELGEPPPELAELHARQRDLETLRGQVSKLAEAEQTAHHADALAEERRKRHAELEGERPGRGGYALALALGVLGVAVALAAAVWTGEPWAGAFGLVALALALPLAHHTWRQRRRGATRVHLAREEFEAAKKQAAKARDAHDDQACAVARTAHGLDLPAEPSPADIATALTDLHHALERRRDWEARQRRAEDAGKALEKAKAELERASAKAEDAAREQARLADGWRAWKAEGGFPEALGPQGVLDFAVQVEAARERLAEKTKQSDALAALRVDIAAWEDAAREVLESRGADAGREGEALILAFTEAAAAIRAEQEAYRRIASAEEALAREGANDPARVAELRGALSDGDAEVWKQERGDLENRLQEEESALEEAIRRHQDTGKQREAVEQSARVSELEMRRNAVAAEIDACRRRWQELTLARRLILDTLEAYERERQPQVFASAGETLARVTGGRYTGIVQDEDGTGFYVLDGDGRRVPPIDLSRGTREQLYLAVRLGLVEEFARRGTALPLIMDEILVNCDAGRMHALAREIRACAERHQILLFTCHPFVVETMRSVDPDARVLPVEALHGGLTTAAQ